VDEFEIDIHWIQAMMGEGLWEWVLYKDGETIVSGTSYWRWTGIWAAKRVAKYYARNGQVRPLNDDSRRIKFTVWDR
jgi:hypothetical protein